MSDDNTFEIRRDDPFNDGKPLENAPVHEAVIHWRARSETKLVPAELFKELSKRLPEYPSKAPQHEVEIEFTPGAQEASQTHKANWRGFRFESADKLNVAQFNRNGFAFSRLKQYEAWSIFTAEALRLWDIYAELSKPIEIERLGIRFINMIQLKSMDELSFWLSHCPRSPSDLGISVKQFMHRTNYSIPGHPYDLNVVQVLQPAGNSPNDPLRLILDLDVSTVGVPVEPNAPELLERLEDMRWIKNKAFQSHMTKEAIEKFQ